MDTVKQYETSDKWQHESTNNGVDIYTLGNSENGRIVVRGVAHVHASAQAMVEKLLQDGTDLTVRKEWDPQIASLTVYDDFSASEKKYFACVGRTQFSAPVPFVSDRDFVFIRDAQMKVDGDKIEFFINGVSLEQEDLEKFETQSGAVRGHIFIAAWIVRTINENECTCEIITDIDVNVSEWVPEWIQKRIAMDNVSCLANIKKIVEKNYIKQ
jgi:hypothetical protein